MPTNNKAKRKWETWEGAFRAAGDGYLGVHQGSHVYTLDAATKRREALAPYVAKSWVETYVNGSWKRVGSVEVTTAEVQTSPLTPL